MSGRAVVVGGASGIGAATARALAEASYAVTVADLDIGAAESVAAGLPGAGHLGRRCDVTEEAEVDAVLTEAGTGGELVAVVNSAGTSTLGLLTELDEGEFRRVTDVCLHGAFLVLKHAGRHLADGGAICSLTSLNARQAAVGFGPYCASKAGLAMLTQVAALELAPRRVRVNAVSPGLVDTPLTAPAMDFPGVRDDYLANTPLGRAGTDAEVADAVLFTLRTPWLTGEVLDLNGGAHLRAYPDVHGHVMRALTSAPDGPD